MQVVFSMHVASKKMASRTNSWFSWDSKAIVDGEENRMNVIQITRILTLKSLLIMPSHPLIVGRTVRFVKRGPTTG